MISNVSLKQGVWGHMHVAPRNYIYRLFNSVYHAGVAI